MWKRLLVSAATTVAITVLSAACRPDDGPILESLGHLDEADYR